MQLPGIEKQSLKSDLTIFFENVLKNSHRNYTHTLLVVTVLTFLAGVMRLPWNGMHTHITYVYSSCTVSPTSLIAKDIPGLASYHPFLLIVF